MTDHRKERVRRLIAKRPEITIEVMHDPDLVARDRLVGVLLDLLDARRRSSGR